MEHAFLWGAVTLVSRLILRDNISNSTTQFKYRILKSDINGNVYAYKVMFDNYVFDIEYDFENNNFICGTLEIIQNLNDKKQVYYLQRDGQCFKVFREKGCYVEFHVFSKSQILAIYVEDGKKTYVDSVTITPSADNNESDGFETIRASVVSIPADTSIKYKLWNKSAMPLFAVSGAIDNNCTTCNDVMVFHSGMITMCIYGDIGGQVVSILERPNTGNFDQGSINVLNSDFNQDYTFIYDRKKECYVVTESVKSHNGKDITKREFDYKEDDDMIIADGKKFNIDIVNHNNVVFHKKSFF